jgi:hypothetical protein
VVFCARRIVLCCPRRVKSSVPEASAIPPHSRCQELFDASADAAASTDVKYDAGTTISIALHHVTLRQDRLHQRREQGARR